MAHAIDSFAAARISYARPSMPRALVVFPVLPCAVWRERTNAVDV